MKSDLPIVQRLESKSSELEESRNWHKVMADVATSFMDSAKEANDMTTYKKYEHEFLCCIATYYKLGEIIKKFRKITE